MTLYEFRVYITTIIRLLCTLPSDHPNKSSYHLSPYKVTTIFFFLGTRTIKIYFLSNFQICNTVFRWGRKRGHVTPWTAETQRGYVTSPNRQLGERWSWDSEVGSLSPWSILFVSYSVPGPAKLFAEIMSLNPHKLPRGWYIIIPILFEEDTKG